MRYEDFEVEIKKEKAYIVKYYGNEKQICIPSYIYEYPVVGIGNEAFKDNAYLSLICFPLTLMQIGSKAFMNCLNLKQVNIPRDVKQIGSFCFKNCYSLSNVKLPFYLKRIPYGMFMNCIELSDIEFPDMLEKVSSKAFKGCKKINYMNFPDNLTEIKEDALEDCLNLLEVSFGTLLKSFDFMNLKDIKVQRFTARNPKMCLMNIQEINTEAVLYGYKNSTLKNASCKNKFVELKRE